MTHPPEAPEISPISPLISHKYAPAVLPTCTRATHGLPHPTNDKMPEHRGQSRPRRPGKDTNTQMGQVPADQTLMELLPICTNENYPNTAAFVDCGARARTPYILSTSDLTSAAGTTSAPPHNDLPHPPDTDRTPLAPFSPSANYLLPSILQVLPQFKLEVSSLKIKIECDEVQWSCGKLRTTKGRKLRAAKEQ